MGEVPSVDCQSKEKGKRVQAATLLSGCSPYVSPVSGLGCQVCGGIYKPVAGGLIGAGTRGQGSQWTLLETRQVADQTKAMSQQQVCLSRHLSTCLSAPVPLMSPQ